MKVIISKTKNENHELRVTEPIRKTRRTIVEKNAPGSELSMTDPLKLLSMWKIDPPQAQVNIKKKRLGAINR